MLVNGRKRREVESPPDFLQARGVAVVLDELVQVIEDFRLPFGEREHFIPPVARRRADATGPRVWSRWRDYNANRRRRSILSRIAPQRGTRAIARCASATQVLHSKSQPRRMRMKHRLSAMVVGLLVA